MKTKTQFTNRILSLVLALVMVLGMVPMSALTAYAAADTGPYAPTIEQDGVSVYNNIFANGTPITIEAAGSGTAVWYMDGSTKKYVNPNGANGDDLSGYNVYVGSNNRDGMNCNGSVTMTGGTINTIFAGQSAGAFRGTSTITVTGGTITNMIFCNSRYAVSSNDDITTVTIFDSTGATIDPGDGKADNVVQKKGSNWSVSGNGIVPSGVTLTVNEGETLTVPAGSTLTNNGTIVNNGTITLNGPVLGNSITGSGTVIRNAVYVPGITSNTGISVQVNGVVQTKPVELTNNNLYAYVSAGNVKIIVNGTDYYGVYSGSGELELTSSYVAATDLTGIPESIYANKSAILCASAGNTTLTQILSYELLDAGNTGAVLNDATLTAYGAGTVKIKVTAEDYYSTYSEEFSISVTHIPVTALDGAVPTEGWVGSNISLPTLTISPADASYQTIVWSVVDAGSTGATMNGSTLRATSVGTATIRASIEHGTAYGTAYTKDYTVTFKATETIDISTGSVTIDKKDEQTLTVQYAPFNGGSKDYALGDPIHITGTTSSNTVTVKSGVVANIIIDSLNISSGSGNPFYVESGANVTLTLKNTNSFTTSHYYAAALRVPAGAVLTIDGNGTLTASSSGYGAGIGGEGAQYGETGGTILILGGTVTAKSDDGAGIGGGAGRFASGVAGNGGNITISGGTVTATSSMGAGIGGGSSVYHLCGSGGIINITGGNVTATSTFGAGIGGGGTGDSSVQNGTTGEGGTITISGGTVTASSTNRYGGAGIGSGGTRYGTGNTGGTVTITGGTVKATTAVTNGEAIGKGYKGTSSGTLQDGNGNPVTLYTFTLSGTSNANVTAQQGLGSYGVNDVKTQDADKLYFYLPAESVADSFTADGTVYDCTADDQTYYASHDWSKNDGVCARCGEDCEHENQTGSTCEICGKALHTHRWEYETDGTTITASCTADGCTNTNGGSVTIVAPTELTYNGTAKEATYTGTLATGDAINIVYASTTDELVDEKPVHAGDYTASITIGEVTASVDFTIEKATPTADDFDFIAPTDLIYDGSDKAATVTVKAGITGMGEIQVMYFRYASGMWYDNERAPHYPGKYKVGIWLKEGENYNGVSSIDRIWLGNEFDIVYLETNAEATISGTKGENGWYISDVTLTPPEGYQISKPKYSDGFSDTLAVSGEQNGTITYYLRNTDGEVAEKTVELKIDKTAPVAEYKIGTDGWKQFINTITFGLFCKDYKTVEINYSDDLSGVSAKQYYIANAELSEDELKNIQWNNYTETLNLNATGKYFIYMRVVDNAGHEVILNTEGIVIYEDSVQKTESVSTTYQAGADKDVIVKLNGNTVKSVANGTTVLTAGTDYAVSADGTITLKLAYLDTLNADTYTFTVSYNPQGVENSGVTDLTTTFTLVIDKADGKVSNINISGKTYDGTAVTAPTYDKLGNGVVTVEYKVKGADDSTYTTAAPKNAGDYVVRVTAAEGTNHKAASATAEFSITTASIENAEVTLDPNAVVYNGSEHKPAVTVTWNGTTLTENTDYVVYYRNNVNASDATVLGIVYVVGTNNFEGSIEKEFEITYAQLTEVEVKQQGTLTYNGQEQTPVVSVNAKSVDGCPVTFTYRTSPHDTYGTMPGFTGAGTYTVYFKASAQNHNDYYGSFDVTIAKKAVTVTANDASKTYGDSDPALTYTHTELIGSDALDITVSRASGENANTYTITASQAEGANPNYEITFKTGTFTIHKAALTVTAEDKTATYGDAVPNYTVKYEGFKNGDDKDDLGGVLAFECDYAQFSDKGEYTVKASGYTSGNYTISYVDGKLTVNAKPITVTIQNATSVYGDTLAELKATDNGIVNGDANVYSLATTATGTSNAGKYAITGTALDSNYDVTFVNGEYEITKREITITVDAKNTVVNTTLPTYTYKVEGLVGMDTLVTMPTLTCNANIAVIGEYDITAIGADAGDNYSIKYVPAKLTVLTDNAVDAAAGYTEELKDYDPATVTSEDKAELEEMLSEIETILDDENITDNGKKALEEVKEQVEKLIKEITDAAEATDTENVGKVENVTPENVTPENKTDLEGAKADLEKALEDNGGNYTEDEKKAIEDEIKRIDDALEVIGNVEAVEELIDKLPENITKNDEDAIKAADDAYNALSDYEKSLVNETAKKALTDAKAALAELNKPADPNSPATGDNSNMFLWIALLFISGGAVITLTVVDRKKRMASNR